jgi:sensory rhodopsin
METLNILLNGTLAAGDYIGFTFFTGYMSMLAASIFFIVERGTVTVSYTHLTLPTKP